MSRSPWILLVVLPALACTGVAADFDNANPGHSDAGRLDATSSDAFVPEPGFYAAYFARYRSEVTTNVAPSIDHQWTDGPATEDSGVDRFSVRYTATLQVPEAGLYRFATVADDGVRLWVDDQLIIDDWRPHYVERQEGSIELAAGPASVRLEYFEADLSAELHLYWAPPGEDERVLDDRDVVTAPGRLEGPKPPYANPVYDADCPDPGVLEVGAPAVYYAVCTGGSFPIRKSYDLVMWEPTGVDALPGGRAPWSANGGRNWAPEMHKVGDRFVVYFTAVNGNNVLSIGASTSDSPEGPFVDSGQPLVQHPDGVIDAHYVQDGARHYLVYKIDGNAHGRPTPNYIRELGPDGLSFLPNAPEIELIRNDSATWEGGVVEGSWITKHDGMYYLFYSGNVYDHRYRTGVARASTITGPYEKFGPPILANNSRWVGPGHGSVVHAEGKPYFVYHAWRNNGSGQNVASEGRRIVLDAIVYENGWPRIHNGTPSVSGNPWPGQED